MRTKRNIGAGSLAFIDYAVPCFDLASTLSKSPNDIAKHLAYICAKASADASHFQIEAVGGYVNFRVNDDMLSRTAESAAEWFARNLGAPTKGQLDIVVAGDKNTQSAHDDYDKIYNWIAELYRLAGWKVSSSWLVSDISEDAIDVLSSQIARRPLPSFRNAYMNDARLAKLRSVARQMYAPHAHLDPKVRLAVDKLKAAVQSADMPASEYVYQSEAPTRLRESMLAHDTHEFLDTATRLEKAHIIARPHKQAAYARTTEPEYAVSLRSVSGFLYRGAYLLYLRDRAKGDKVITITPARYHEMLALYAKTTRRISESISPDKVSRVVNRLERCELDSSLGDTLAMCVRTLSEPSAMQQFNSRHQLLAAIDFWLSLIGESTFEDTIAALDCLAEVLEQA